MKRNKKIRKIIASVVIMVLSFSIMTGSTFAIFTGGDNVDVAVKSGKIDVTATVDKTTLKAYSKGVEQTLTDENGNLLFENGGSVSFTDEGDLVLDCITPGDRATFEIKVVNASNIAIMYRVIWSVEGELVSALVATANDESITNGKSEWATWNMSNGNDYTLQIAVELPYETDFNYQDKTATISYSIEAVQGNADIPDEWDGTADVSWYNEEDTEFTLSTAEQIAGLASLVNGTAVMPTDVEINLPVSFEGKTVKLDGNVDLAGTTWVSIGSGSNPFMGNFDGQGYTISNIQQSIVNGAAVEEGLFGSIKDSKISNVNLDGCYFEGYGPWGGFVAASAKGTCVFDNITLTNNYSSIYNDANGGIVGYIYGDGNYTFSNISIDESNIIEGLWGSPDCALGGVIGYADFGSNNLSPIKMENVTVAAKIDGFNDACANYQYFAYRYSGMLIGYANSTIVVDNTTLANANTLICSNVKVIYDDWANYTYCEFESNGKGSYNAPGDWKYSRVQGNKTYGGVEENHQHDTDENHEMLLEFNQLFGGGQGVYGNPTFDGVEVIYNHK